MNPFRSSFWLGVILAVEIGAAPLAPAQSAPARMTGPALFTAISAC